MARPVKYTKEKQLQYIEMYLVENGGVTADLSFATLERFTRLKGEPIPADTFRRTPEVCSYIQKLKEGKDGPQEEDADVYRTMSFVQVTEGCERSCKNLEPIKKKLADQAELAKKYYQKYVDTKEELQKAEKDLALARARCSDLEERLSAKEREKKNAGAVIVWLQDFIKKAITGPVGHALVVKEFGIKGLEFPDYLDKEVLESLTKELKPSEKKEKGNADGPEPGAGPILGQTPEPGAGPVPEQTPEPGQKPEQGSKSTGDVNEDFLSSLEDD